jgi:DNA polymerase
LEKRNKELLRQLDQELRFLSDLGAEFIFAPDKGIKLPEKISGGTKTQPNGAVLHDLEEKILRCTLCPLSRNRTKAVPGEGDYEARLMFVGEAPGEDEDIQGRPFVGRAGQLLTRIIEAMKFKRDQVYITNVVKCRPPKNRTPVREEIEQCRAYLTAQIEAIGPNVIVSLGKVATDFFHPAAAGMTRLRGHFIEYRRILVMPTFHPSYVLRNEDAKGVKKLVWEDMQQVMAALGKK